MIHKRKHCAWKLALGLMEMRVPIPQRYLLTEDQCAEIKEQPR
ncbi:hypothetical protein BH10CYA1_BH10CYA1_60630 [soil metagenome]